MADIKPFKAYRPTKDNVGRVSALPYDVFSRKEAYEKVKENPEDKKSPSLMELAIKQAKSLKEFKQAMRNGSKEFPYNGCTYQYREEVTIDLSKCEGPYAEDWQLQQSVIENIDRQIAALRNDQKAAKSAMEADGKNYLSENPECDKVKVTKKPSIVVL